MTRNAHVDGDLVLLRDGLLDPRDEARVRAHLTGCARCRELDAAIAFNCDVLSELEPPEMRAEDVARVRASLRDAAPKRVWPRIALAAAALLVVAFTAFLLRPHVVFVNAPGRPRSIERVAWAAQTFERVASRDDARTRIQRQTGAWPKLKPDRGNRRLVGVAPGTFVYDIDGRRVRLAVALARNVPDAAPSLPWAKRLEVRHTSGARVFTWSAGQDTYSLIVPRGVAAEDACAICHDGTRTLEIIRPAAKGL